MPANTSNRNDFEAVKAMIRGVNKHIIEVVNTNNEYFEKAILFVNPDKADSGRNEMMHVARDYLGSMGQPTGKKRSARNIALGVLRLALVFALGVAVTAVVFYYFG